MGKLADFDERTEQKGGGKKTLWQFVKFSVMSSLAGITQYVVLNIMLLLPFIKALFDTPFTWFVFHYPVSAQGLGYFIAYNVANTLAGLVSFIGNRKKTFKANNSFSITLLIYFVWLFVLLILTCWMSPYIQSWLLSFNMNTALAANITITITGSVQFLLNFPFDKILMRRHPEIAEENADAAEKTDAAEKAEVAEKAETTEKSETAE